MNLLIFDCCSFVRLMLFSSIVIFLANIGKKRKTP